ncbi:MAG: NAD(P)-dependent oxidoreductase [Roseiflexaceae bacterium]|nr:NAD(P)-dependent oxidoreductase [Roseiflexaceae bacterium]
MANESPIQTIAMIGVGRMGGPMALHLLRAGFTVRGYDTSAVQLAALAEQGITAAQSIAQAVAGADLIITMLPSNEALEHVSSATGGLLDLIQPGQILIDMSTSKLATSQQLAQQIRQRGANMLDAPVSGGEQGARNATLSIMVGGDAAIFEHCQRALAAMGSSSTHVGGNGMGLIAKYVNQLLMEASFCAIAEAFALAAQAGADLESIYQAVRNGLGGSRVLDQMLPQLLSGDLGSGRELTLHHKDLSYLLASGEALGVWMPLAQQARQIFDQAIADGHGSESAVAVARVYEQRIGVRLVKHNSF